MLIDAETLCIADINGFALEVLGMKRNEVIGRCCSDFFCPEQNGQCPVINQGKKVENKERTLINANGETKIIPQKR